MLDEYLNHLGKIKELLQEDKFSKIDLESLITEAPSLEENAFGEGKTTNIKKSICLREAHDCIKSFKRLKNFFSLERSDFYSTAKEEYELYEQQWDFHRTRLERLAE